MLQIKGVPDFSLPTTLNDSSEDDEVGDEGDNEDDV
jgi:hypothetical protein